MSRFIFVTENGPTTMTKFDIYGLGNALVDIDFETSFEALELLKVEKGLMTLVDAERHLELLNQLNNLKQVKSCGGSAANTIMTIQMLGGTTFYSCKVANDEAGDFFCDELARYGVASNLLHQERLPGRTGSCLVLVTPDADRTMNTHLGISETLSANELSEESIADSKYLYIEGYLSSSPTGSNAAIKAMQHAKLHGTKTSLTLSDQNMITYFNNNLLDMLTSDGVDLLFCNEDEAKLFSQSDNLNIVCNTLKKYAKTFAITQGPKGSIVYDGQHLYDISARDVPVIDSVGAGDTYAGGFIYAITHGYDFEKAGIIADIAASKVISKYGPRLDAAEIAEVQSEIKNL